MVLAGFSKHTDVGDGGVREKLAALSTLNWVINGKTIGLSGAGQARRMCVVDTRASSACHAALPQR